MRCFLCVSLYPKEELQRLLDLLKKPEPLPEEQLQKLCIEMNDFIVALSSVQPSAKREGFVTIPDVTWADIGALEDVREELTMAILVCVNVTFEGVWFFFLHLPLCRKENYSCMFVCVYLSYNVSLVSSSVLQSRNFATSSFKIDFYNLLSNLLQVWCMY